MKQGSNVILAGLALAAVGFGGRYLLRGAGGSIQKEWAKLLPQGLSGSHFYKGGFDAKMSRREAGLILGVSPSTHTKKIKEAHKRIMLLNHPDKGNSISKPECPILILVPNKRRIALSGH